MPNLFCSPVDLVGEGIDVVLDRVAATGADRIRLAASYHAARDLLPHNPMGIMHYGESGVVSFAPEATRYPDPVARPIESGVTAGTDVVAETIAAAHARGIAVDGWTVLLHNSRLATADPGLAQVTAFGQALRHALCPANPRAARYAEVLAGEVADLGVDDVVFESVGYADFEHGTHHERDLLGLSGWSRFLLGICFCASCMALGRRSDVDSDGLRDAVRLEVSAEVRDGRMTEAAYAWEAASGTRAVASSAFGGALGRYLQAREDAVTDLVGRLALAVGRQRSVVLDASGARAGYADGRPADSLHVVEHAWRDGVDLAAVGAVCRVESLGYLADPSRLRREILTASSVIGTTPSVVLRPMPPDARTRDDVLRAVTAATDAGAPEIGFYHYGLMRLRSLEWIREALNRTG